MTERARMRRKNRKQFAPQWQAAWQKRFGDADAAWEAFEPSSQYRWEMAGQPTTPRWAPIHHWLPKGSCTPARRSPSPSSAGSISDLIVGVQVQHRRQWRAVLLAADHQHRVAESQLDVGAARRASAAGNVLGLL